MSTQGMASDPQHIKDILTLYLQDPRFMEELDQRLKEKNLNIEEIDGEKILELMKDSQFFKSFMDDAE